MYTGCIEKRKVLIITLLINTKLKTMTNNEEIKRVKYEARVTSVQLAISYTGSPQDLHKSILNNAEDIYKYLIKDQELPDEA